MLFRSRMWTRRARPAGFLTARGMVWAGGLVLLSLMFWSGFR